MARSVWSAALPAVEVANVSKHGFWLLLGERGAKIG